MILWVEILSRICYIICEDKYNTKMWILCSKINNFKMVRVEHKAKHGALLSMWLHPTAQAVSTWKLSLILSNIKKTRNLQISAYFILKLDAHFCTPYDNYVLNYLHRSKLTFQDGISYCVALLPGNHIAPHTVWWENSRWEFSELLCSI